jgi:hypothetical protein
VSKLLSIFVLVTLTLLVCPQGVVGQTTPAPQPSTAKSNGPVRVFLDCTYFCDEEFIRREITFVDYVRDRTDADVHILLTTEGTGGGGTEYTIKFIGLGRFADVEQTLRHAAPTTATEDERRKAVSEVLKQGLVRYVAESPLASRLRISVAPADEKAAAQQTAANDPWNLWAFRTNVGGSFSGEQSTTSHSLRGSASANRTTEAWKLEFSASGSRRNATYDLGDGEIFTSRSQDFGATAWIVKSLDAHWSAALNGRVASSTFVNQDLHTRTAAGVEYDIYPYSESTRRLLTLQYTLGLSTFDYDEVTIFGKTEEKHLDHRFQTTLSMRQPWGSSYASVRFSQFLTKADKFSISAFGDASVRLFKGFSVNVFGEIARTRDQLYLPAAGATPEEILVRQQQLATDYQYYLSFGISYSFGSIFNNVVNPRFGT